MSKPNLMKNGANATIARTPLINTPRSVFPVSFSRKQTMQASYLYPIFYQETIPGDTWDIDLTQFTRMAPQITAPMDNLWYYFYFFYTPNRLVWENFSKQHGERKNPDDTIDYITPTITSTNGFEIKSIYDYMGGIRTGQKGTKISALPLRTYNLIWNEYFRASEIQDSLTVKTDDSDDNEEDYTLQKVGKVHDYFTDQLPTLLAGGEEVNIPLGEYAPVVGNGNALGLTAGNATRALVYKYNSNGNIQNSPVVSNVDGIFPVGTGTTADGGFGTNRITIGVTQDETQSGLIAKLNNAVAASVQAMRLAIDTCELLERDNRSGSRYTELMYGRYGVALPDLMLYRPQLIGYMTLPVFTTPVVQTSGTGTTGQTTPQGNITGYGVSASKGNVIKVSCGEFGNIIGLACIRAIPQYQQGLDKKWTRFERYDYYYPEFMALSDQGVKKSEIFLQDNDIINETTGEPVNDDIMGYIGRYDELRYFKNEICGEFRSDYTNTLDSWHYAEKFETAPELNSEFLEDDTNEILKRTLAIQTDLEGTNNAEQFLCDFQFTGSVIRPIPTKAIPQTGGRLL